MRVCERDEGSVYACERGSEIVRESLRRFTGERRRVREGERRRVRVCVCEREMEIEGERER